MTKPKIPQEFIVKIAIKDESGRHTGEKEFVTYAGLLSVAHDVGLDEISATVLQMPTESNGMTAVVRAIAKGKTGLFTGLGDASPANVNRRVAKHVLRIAETRAKARALRDLTNIAMVALEELGDDADIDLDPLPPTSARVVALAPHAERRVDRRPALASDNQKRAMFRKALALGHQGPDAHTFLSRRLGIAIERATKDQASKLLDELTREESVVAANGANGAGHAAE